MSRSSRLQTKNCPCRSSYMALDISLWMVLGAWIIGMIYLLSSSNTKKIHVRFPCPLSPNTSVSIGRSGTYTGPDPDRLQYIDFTGLSIETKSGRMAYENYESSFGSSTELAILSMSLTTAEKAQFR